MGVPRSGTACLRLYAWEPSAVSLGFHQPPDAIDRGRCRAEGWDVVRRPTGGRALLHHNDLSYSLTLPGGASSPAGLKRLYEGVATAFVKALEMLGVEAEFVPRGREGAREIHIRDGLCLGSHVRGELLARGRKITAAAQRIYPEAILQHGSIPLRGDVGAISRVAMLPEQEITLASLRLRSMATTLDEAARRDVSWEELAVCIVETIARQFDFQWTEAGWTAEEIAAIESLRGGFDIQTATK